MTRAEQERAIQNAFAAVNRMVEQMDGTNLGLEDCADCWVKAIGATGYKPEILSALLACALVLLAEERRKNS